MRHSSKVIGAASVYGQDHEGVLGNTLPLGAHSVLVRAHEAEARIVTVVSQYNDKRPSRGPYFCKAVVNELGSDSLILMHRQNGHGTESETFGSPVSVLDRHWREQEVPSYLAGNCCHERHHVRSRPAKGLDNVRLLGLAEGELVNGPNREVVVFSFAANVDHAPLVLQGSNERAEPASPR